MDEIQRAQDELFYATFPDARRTPARAIVAEHELMYAPTDLSLCSHAAATLDPCAPFDSYSLSAGMYTDPTAHWAYVGPDTAPPRLMMTLPLSPQVLNYDYGTPPPASASTAYSDLSPAYPMLAIEYPPLPDTPVVHDSLQFPLPPHLQYAPPPAVILPPSSASPPASYPASSPPYTLPLPSPPSYPDHVLANPPAPTRQPSRLKETRPVRPPKRRNGYYPASPLPSSLIAMKQEDHDDDEPSPAKRARSSSSSSSSLERDADDDRSPPASAPSTSASTSKKPTKATAKSKDKEKDKDAPKKPPLACLFCRGRKIACGPPAGASAGKGKDKDGAGKEGPGTCGCVPLSTLYSVFASSFCFVLFVFAGELASVWCGIFADFARPRVRPRTHARSVSDTHLVLGLFCLSFCSCFCSPSRVPCRGIFARVEAFRLPV
ncbi:hypothetical protein K438DRAFT_656778 [Mycena galopus ATCC 62051]|nr:hypothetical protein K438DRAFT_656778 [Mycena galopus ATCC 62051]